MEKESIVKIERKIEITVDKLFPSAVACVDNLMPSDYNEILKDICLDTLKVVDDGGAHWPCNTFSSMGTYDILTDDRFSRINESVTDIVRQLAREIFDSDFNYQPKNGWFNVADEYAYQEYHIHPDSVFSAVYYVCAPEGSGDLVFESPLQQMVLVRNTDGTNEFTHGYYKYTPKPGTLILFRSHMKHMVQQHTNENNCRISLSYNFD